MYSWWGIGVIIACVLLTISVLIRIFRLWYIRHIYLKDPEYWDKKEEDYQANKEIDWLVEVQNAMKNKGS